MYYAYILCIYSVIMSIQWDNSGTIWYIVVHKGMMVYFVDSKNHPTKVPLGNWYLVALFSVSSPAGHPTYGTSATVTSKILGFPEKSWGVSHVFSNAQTDHVDHTWLETKNQMIVA